MAEHPAVRIREARAEYAPGHRLFAFGMPLAGG
jgi:hypothetical protein